MSDVSQQCQTKPASTDESNISPGARTFNEKRFDLSAGRHAKGHTFLPLLPDRRTDCLKQGAPSLDLVTGSFPPGSPSAVALNTERPSHERRERFPEAAAQGNNVRLTQSQPVRRYEWPLIINGVYQGEGPLQSCRIEDNESPREARPYEWPLIILHRASSVEDCDQQAGPNGKEAKDNTAVGDEKVAGPKTDDEGDDESSTTARESAEG